MPFPDAFNMVSAAHSMRIFLPFFDHAITCLRTSQDDRAKWEAWKKLTGKNRKDAMNEYAPSFRPSGRTNGLPIR